jgi:hypothetical protein
MSDRKVLEIEITDDTVEKKHPLLYPCNKLSSFGPIKPIAFEKQPKDLKDHLA